MVVRGNRTGVSVLRAVLMCGLLLYTGGPPHETFIESDHPRILVRAGNQVGKTWAAAKKVWDFALGHPGCTILVVCADHTAKVQTAGKALWELAPRHLLEQGCDWNITRGWQNNVIRLTNGVTVLFRSAEGSTVSISGLTVHACWVDEPPKQSQWGEITSRCAVHRAPIWLTMTPVGREVGWLRLMVEGNKETGELPTEDWQQIVIELTPEHCPWRTQEDIDAQAEGYGAWEYAQRVHGDWEGVTPDRSLDAFDDTCVSDQIPQAMWDLGLGIDHGELAGREAVELVLWSLKRKQVWVVDEYISETSTTPEADAKEIRALLARRGATPESVDLAVGDTNSSGKANPGVSVNRMLEDELPGLHIGTPDKRAGSVDYRIRLINLAFKRGHLKVHPRCQSFIRSCRHWRNKTSDEDLKHVLDAGGYLLVKVLERMYDREDIDRLRMIRP